MGKTKISLQADVPHGDRRSPRSGSEAVGAGEWKFKLEYPFRSDVSSGPYVPEGQVASSGFLEFLAN